MLQFLTNIWLHVGNSHHGRAIGNRMHSIEL